VFRCGLVLGLALLTPLLAQPRLLDPQLQARLVLNVPRNTIAPDPLDNLLWLANANGDLSRMDPDAPAPVALGIYTLGGQRVRSLARGAQKAGQSRLWWHGRDDQGRPLASGVYLHRLQAGDHQTSRRPVLAK